MANVIKRDGTQVQFDVNKIIGAIMKAQESLNVSNFDSALTIATAIQNQFFGTESVHLEIVQECIESMLMSTEPDVARKYIEYRAKHDQMREGK